MSKIIKAVNAMISNKDKIGTVLHGPDGSEFFFKYDNKHKWSIMKFQNDYSLHYYLGDHNIETLASMDDDEWHEFGEMVSYRTQDLGTKEAYSSLSELYTIVQEKLYDMDKVLDDIINDDLF